MGLHQILLTMPLTSLHNSTSPTQHTYTMPNYTNPTLWDKINCMFRYCNSLVTPLSILVIFALQIKKNCKWQWNCLPQLIGVFILFVTCKMSIGNFYSCQLDSVPGERDNEAWELGSNHIRPVASNSPNCNPVDYRILTVKHEHVYQKPVRNVNELKQDSLLMHVSKLKANTPHVNYDMLLHNYEQVMNF